MAKDSKKSNTKTETVTKTKGPVPNYARNIKTESNPG